MRDIFRRRGQYSGRSFFLIRIVGGGVQTGSTRQVLLAYCTWPGLLWGWKIWWNEDCKGKPNYSEKTCPSATLSTTIPTWTEMGANPGRCGGKPATNRVSYGAASWEAIISVILNKRVCMYMCPIPNDFKDRAISLYSSEIVDKKEILPTICNTGICCSRDKVGSVYLFREFHRQHQYLQLVWGHDVLLVCTVKQTFLRNIGEPLERYTKSNLRRLQSIFWA
jgi:hypothetical protein